MVQRVLLRRLPCQHIMSKLQLTVQELHPQGFRRIQPLLRKFRGARRGYIAKVVPGQRHGSAVACAAVHRGGTRCSTGCCMHVVALLLCALSYVGISRSPAAASLLGRLLVQLPLKAVYRTRRRLANDGGALECFRRWRRCACISTARLFKLLSSHLNPPPFHSFCSRHRHARPRAAKWHISSLNTCLFMASEHASRRSLGHNEFVWALYRVQHPTHRSTCAAAQCNNSCFLEVWLQQVTCKCFDFVCVSLPCTVILNAIPHFRTVSGTPSFFLNGVSIDADPAWTSADWQQVLRVRVGSRVTPYTSLAVIRL